MFSDMQFQLSPQHVQIAWDFLEAIDSLSGISEKTSRH
jgi:hypothetical protein